MKRRKALKSLGLGLSAGFLLPEFLAACKGKDPGPEVEFAGTVAVVGAGAAGLYAADILRAKGIKVIIVEAGEELGGRVKSLRNQNNIPSESIADFPVELGAEVTFGSDSIWGKFAETLHVPTVDLSSSENKFVLDQVAKSATEWAGDTDLAATEAFIASLPSYSGAAVSIKSAAGLSARAEGLLNGQVGNFYGSNSDNVGVVGIAQDLQARTHDNVWFTMKANPFQDLLLSRFSLIAPQVLKQTQITSINYSGEKVSMTDQNGNVIEADKVIVTVPVSVLKSGDISFTPGLPSAMTSSLSRIGMDASIRVVVDFKKNFWGLNTGFIWGGTDAPQYFNAGVGRSEYYKTLSITINGPKAVELSAMGADMINPILTELDTIFHTEAEPTPATRYVRRIITEGDDGETIEGLPITIIQDWSKEQFIKGGISYPMLGATIDDRKNLGANIDGKLFFAGEATDVSGDAGTINGALASAERVTEEIVKSILGITV